MGYGEAWVIRGRLVWVTFARLVQPVLDVMMFKGILAEVQYRLGEMERSVSSACFGYISPVHVLAGWLAGRQARFQQTVGRDGWTLGLATERFSRDTPPAVNANKWLSFNDMTDPSSEH